MTKKALPKPEMKNGLHGALIEVEVKRFYVPLKFSAECPFCGRDSELDLEDQYLSYPTIGAVETVEVHCGNEDCAAFERAIARGEYSLSLVARMH